MRGSMAGVCVAGGADFADGGGELGGGEGFVGEYEVGGGIGRWGRVGVGLFWDSGILGGGTFLLA